MMTRSIPGQGLIRKEDDNKGHELDVSSLHGPGIYVHDKSCKCIKKNEMPTENEKGYAA